MARVGRAALVALALAVAVAPRQSYADDDAERAEAAFREGNRAFAAGDYHAAYDAYRAAWTLKQAFDIACNLGRTEIELGLSRDAAEHLDYCLRTFSVSSRDDVRDANKRFRELFDMVRKEVGALTVEVRPPGAEITVDGASYGLAPLGRAIFLSPGRHVVRARLTGFHDEERSIAAEPGSTLGVSLTLTAQGAKAPTAAPLAAQAAIPPASQQPARSGMEPRTIVLISGAAASFVALGIGVGFALDAAAAHDDASRLGATANQEGGNGCVSVTASPTCAALHDAVHHENLSRDRADVALMTGAVLGGATIGAWLLIPDLKRTQFANLRALPWVGRETSGVTFAGTY
jgi:hypothetical protein